MDIREFAKVRDLVRDEFAKVRDEFARVRESPQVRAESAASSRKSSVSAQVRGEFAKVCIESAQEYASIRASSPADTRIRKRIYVNIRSFTSDIR